MHARPVFQGLARRLPDGICQVCPTSLLCQLNVDQIRWRFPHIMIGVDGMPFCFILFSVFLPKVLDQLKCLCRSPNFLKAHFGVVAHTPWLRCVHFDAKVFSFLTDILGLVTRRGVTVFDEGIVQGLLVSKASRQFLRLNGPGAVELVDFLIQAIAFR